MQNGFNELIKNEQEQKTWFGHNEN
jgi:hypothetical protein